MRKENAMMATIFEDVDGDEFTVTTDPELGRIELEILDPDLVSVIIGPEIAPKVASLILSTFGKNVGVEFLPCGRAIVHSGEGVNRVSMDMPENAARREELLNVAIVCMGAINGYDTAMARQDEDGDALDQEALALHNAYYGDDLEEPWTLEKLRKDDAHDLECFRRAAQAARRVYAQAAGV